MAALRRRKWACTMPTKFVPARLQPPRMRSEQQAWRGKIGQFITASAFGGDDDF